MCKHLTIKNSRNHREAAPSLSLSDDVYSTVWHKIFSGCSNQLRYFPAISKNKFPQIKITADIFPAKLYSNVNTFLLKPATQKYSTKKSYRIVSKSYLSLSFRNKTVYNGPVGENPGNEVEWNSGTGFT